MRLTKENPNGNFETALNLFYCKDKMAWVRGGGAAPDYEDAKLTDWIRNLFREYGDFKEIADYTDAELIKFMGELALDGTETIDGLLATLYHAGWAFAELNAKLMDYEDSGLTPEGVKEMKSRMEGLEK